jgi:hypothetical protein
MHERTDRSTAIRLFSVAVALSACALTASCTGPSPPPTSSPPTSSVITDSSAIGSPVISSPPTTTARFTGLHKGSLVSYPQLVAGVVSGIPAGRDTWLVVQPILAPRFWPQSGPLLIVGGQFNAVVYFGTSAVQGKGQEFNLLIVSAPENASQRFQEFTQKPEATGLARLPDGAQALSEVLVKRP